MLICVKGDFSCFVNTSAIDIETEFVDIVQNTTKLCLSKVGKTCSCSLSKKIHPYNFVALTSHDAPMGLKNGQFKQKRLRLTRKHSGGVCPAHFPQNKVLHSGSIGRTR